MAQDQSEIRSLPDKHDHLQPYIADATVEPIPFPTKIVLRMQPPNAATNGESGPEDDFTLEDLRHMLWDYAGSPAPPSDLAGLTKRCIHISCGCITRVIHGTHELLEWNIDWLWIEKGVFENFKCFYCSEGFTARLDAYHKAQARWVEDSRRGMEKSLHGYLYRDFVDAHPTRSNAVLVRGIDK